MKNYLKLFPAIRCIFFEEKSKKDAASIRAKLSAIVGVLSKIKGFLQGF
ncbi:hypothetical protein [Changchengzhania lutea]|nr:hypothetical protein [Changchengzhania lutea]